MLYEKKILSPGTYTVRSKDGSIQRVFISRDRIKKWISNFKQMTENGLKIPAPWRHDDSGPIRTIGDTNDVSSNNNAGWWKELREDSDGSLWGSVEVPLEADASKIGTTVQDVSPLVRPEFVDGGTGTVYEDAITHIALVTHPVIPNQENFNAIALSSEYMISEKDVTNGSALSLTEALRCLKARGISLPPDTTIENLVERLVVACQAIESAEMESEEDDSEDSVDTPPKDSKTQPDPIVMSQETTLKLSAEDQARINFATKQITKSYSDRLNACVANGQVTAQMVEGVKPLLENFQLELSAEGEIVKSPIDAILEAWEMIPEGSLFGPRRATNVRNTTSKATLALSHDLRVEELPDDGGGDFDPEEILKQQFANSGMSGVLRS